MMKHAIPRATQQPKTNPHACFARLGEVVHGLNQRPSRKRIGAFASSETTTEAGTDPEGPLAGR
jgi:hypothetical protein